jgi:hypothetical protein
MQFFSESAHMQLKSFFSRIHAIVLNLILQTRLRYKSDLLSIDIKSKFFFIFAGFFSTIFGEKSGAFLFGKLRRACPGPLRKLRPELSHIISAGCTHVPLPGPRS